MKISEAIKWIDNRMCWGRGQWTEHHQPIIDEPWQAGRMAIEALKATQWIPCSERLPSENGDYLVTLENGVVKILGYSTTQRTTYPKGFYHIEDGFSWRQIQNPVVAWMPLPEAWKGADDGI